MSKHIVVTGGLGFIGSQFVNYLIDETSYEVTILDKETYAADTNRIKHIFPSERLKWIRMDIREVRSSSWLNTVDCIVNFAAETHVDNSIADSQPFVETNVNGVVNLLELSKEYDIEFIQISTDEVYGSIPWFNSATETWSLATSSPYSASKAAADLFIESYGKTHGLKYKIVRPSNNYGPGQHPEKLIPKAVSLLKQKKKVPIYGDGKQVRQWVHVEDTARAIYLVMENGENHNIYNVGGLISSNNIELIDKLASKFVDGYDGNVKDFIEFVEDRKGHDYRYSISSSKIYNELKWYPKKLFLDEISKL
jgi:dTDP-glucose 4,6-dehydratase